MGHRMNVPEAFLYTTQSKEVGVLLIHGFTGTTAELQPLGRYLYHQGYTVHAPLLKGHGVTVEEMKCTTWIDWYVSAKEGYKRLKEEGCKQIVVAGLSMGGLLALKIAQHHPVLGMISLCAPIKVKDKRMAMVGYLRYFMEYKKRKEKKVEHIEQELYIYDKTPLSCIHSLHKLMQNVEEVIPHLHQPILVVQAEKDETVDPCSGDLLYQRIGSKNKELVLYQHSGHIITLDIEKEHLFEKMTSFIQDVEKEQGTLERSELK